MRTYEVVIRPEAGFGTPLAGDTLFGHLCWQAAYDPTLFGASLDDLLANYDRDPFVVVSSPLPRLTIDGAPAWALPRPALPLGRLLSGKVAGDGREGLMRRKELKQRRHMILKSGRRLDSFAVAEFLTDADLLARMGLAGDSLAKTDHQQSHNRISRITGTTGDGELAPYSVGQVVYRPGVTLSLVVAVRDGVPVSGVVTALQRIGDSGYGRDASTGLGRFAVVGEATAIDLAALGASKADACLALAPVVPCPEVTRAAHFQPFVRYGRHGDRMARSKNPFKAPVLFGEVGAVVVPRPERLAEVLRRPVIGRAVTGVSKAEERTVTQGYAPYLPICCEAVAAKGV